MNQTKLQPKHVTGPTIGFSKPSYQYLLKHVNNFGFKGDLSHVIMEQASEMDMPEMLAPPDEVSLLTWLIQLTRSKKVMEIGVFRATTTYSLAQAVGSGGEVVALDLNKKYADDCGMPYLKKSNIENRVRFIEGLAVDSMKKLLEHEANTYDLIFVDADKNNYEQYYELSLQLLKPNGIMAIDNVLLGGDVCDESKRTPNVQGIRAVNEKILQDKRVSATMLGIADGLYLVRKI